MSHNAPRTIAQLVSEARNYEFSTAVPIKVYLRTAKEVLRHVCDADLPPLTVTVTVTLTVILTNLSNQAGLYASQENYADAYVLYVRFLDLVVNNLPKYSALRRDERSKRLYNHLVKETRTAMEKAEKMKAIVEEEIESYQRYLELQARQRQELDQRRRSPSPAASISDDFIEVRQNSNDIHDFDDFQFEKHLSNFFAKSDDFKLVTPSYPALSHVYPKQTAAENVTIPDDDNHPSVPPKIIEQQPTTVTIEKIPDKLPSAQTEPKIQHKSISSTESGKPLKTLYTPTELESSFLKIAHSNTLRKLETCGILCGRLSLNAFFITSLLIPKQESTSNTCQTIDEESIFEYIDKNDLFVLGWIHTHPTQSCFLSSIDLHTQNSYQIMLPEAIAIVCSPKFPSNKFGIFRLTDPPGISIITNCQRSGFHPHEEANIYKRCSKANKGHVVLKNGLPFEVVDLRK
jgi:STAM-binding protein